MLDQLMEIAKPTDYIPEVFVKVEYKGNTCKLNSGFSKLWATIKLVSYIVNSEVSNDVVSKSISFLDFNDGFK